ncbi:general transcription factor II-I repeat domain-containing protein 2-like [Trachinotus anak]|uniref:general transcription factor II-I repeat domain-containing protein 2-like n=1 Tax=Trachinotus anak TaxID=443729 RepID=UPI0039F1D6B1
MAKEYRKRKYEEEYRTFKEDWELEFFFVSTGSTERWRAEAEKLKQNRTAQKNVFHTNTSERATEASYKITHELMKKMKPYTDGEMVKDCILLACSTLFPEKKDLEREAKKIILSDSTVARRASDISENIAHTLKDKLSSAEFVSLAMDESFDINDTPQLLIFIRAINSKFDITEELLDMVSLENGTTGIEIKNAVLETLEKFNIGPEKITAFTTDGAPAMLGKRHGAVALLKETLKNGGVAAEGFFSYHCIVHQQALFAKFKCLNEVMANVIEVVNYIRARARNHLNFKLLCEEFDTHYGDLVLHTEMRWLSKGRMFAHFMDLLEPLKSFIVGQGETSRFSFLDDKQWVLSVALLCDITQHLNELNLKMQGRNKTVYELYTAVRVFSDKLDAPDALLLCQSQFCDVLTELKQNYTSRFHDFKDHSNIFLLVKNPFLIEVNEMKQISDQLGLVQLQMEFVELKSSDELQRQFRITDVVDFWKLVGHLPNISRLARRIISMFPSTYRCKAAFSALSKIKCRNRNRLSLQHTTEALRIAVSSAEPDFKSLVRQKECQKSH